eukprot:g33182.t1
MIHIYKNVGYLFGKDRRIVDVPTDHPTCSKQHAVLHYRQTSTGLVKPYIMDLESVNGTFVNGSRIDAARYVELREKDVLKFESGSRRLAAIARRRWAPQGGTPGEIVAKTMEALLQLGVHTSAAIELSATYAARATIFEAQRHWKSAPEMGADAEAAAAKAGLRGAAWEKFKASLLPVVADWAADYGLKPEEVGRSILDAHEAMNASQALESLGKGRYQQQTGTEGKVETNTEKGKAAPGSPPTAAALTPCGGGLRQRLAARGSNSGLSCSSDVEVLHAFPLAAAAGGFTGSCHGSDAHCRADEARAFLEGHIWRMSISQWPLPLAAVICQELQDERNLGLLGCESQHCARGALQRAACELPRLLTRAVQEGDHAALAACAAWSFQGPAPQGWEDSCAQVAMQLAQREQWDLALDFAQCAKHQAMWALVLSAAGRPRLRFAAASCAATLATAPSEEEALQLARVAVQIMQESVCLGVIGSLAGGVL